MGLGERPPSNGSTRPTIRSGGRAPSICGWPIVDRCSFPDGDSLPRSQRSTRSHDKAMGNPVPLVSLRKTFHRHREADNQAFGFPVVGKLTFELPCHEPAHERTSEPFMFRRPVEGWAAMLFPGQHKLILL